MRRLILVFVLGTLASSLAEEQSCREIDGGMECASRSGDSASYTKSISRTGESARMSPLPPLPPLKPLRPLFPPMRPLFPPLRPLLPPIRPSYIQPLDSFEYLKLPQQQVPALPEYFRPQPELTLPSLSEYFRPQPELALLSIYRRKRSVGNVLLPYQPKGNLQPYEPAVPSPYRRKRSVGNELFPYQPKGDLLPYEPAVPSPYRRKRSPQSILGYFEPTERPIFVPINPKPTAPYDGPYPYDPNTEIGAYLNRQWLKGEDIPLPPGRNLPVPLFPQPILPVSIPGRPLPVPEPVPLFPVGQSIPGLSIFPGGRPTGPISISPINQPIPIPGIPIAYRRKRSDGNVLLPYQPKGDLLPYEPAVPSPYRRKRSVGNVLLPYRPKGDLLPYEPAVPSPYRRKRSVGNVLLPYRPKGDLLPYDPAVPSPYRRKRSPQSILGYFEPTQRPIFVPINPKPTAPYDLVQDPKNYGPYPYDPYTEVGAYLDRQWLKGENIPLPPGINLPVPLVPVPQPQVPMALSSQK